MINRKLMYWPFLLGLFCICAGALVLWQQASEKTVSCAMPAYRVDVIRAEKTLSAGDVVRKSDLTQGMIPERFVPVESIRVEEVQKILGESLCRDVPKDGYLEFDDFSGCRGEPDSGNVGKKSEYIKRPTGQKPQPSVEELENYREDEPLEAMTLKEGLNKLEVLAKERVERINERLGKIDEDNRFDGHRCNGPGPPRP